MLLFSLIYRFSSPYYPTSYPTDYTADAYYGGAGDFRYQGSHPSEQNEETIVFVYGIGSRADEDCLWHLFSPFGNILVSFLLIEENFFYLALVS